MSKDSVFLFLYVKPDLNDKSFSIVIEYNTVFFYIGSMDTLFSQPVFQMEQDHILDPNYFQFAANMEGSSSFVYWYYGCDKSSTIFVVISRKC